jgi:type VI secretion system protein VasG
MNLKSLVSRLNPLCREALESAAGLTLSRTHYNVEIEHWLLKMLDTPNSDLSVILSHFEIDAGTIVNHLNRSLDKVKTGNGRAPALAPYLIKLAKEAWMTASLDYGAAEVRSGHVLMTLLKDEDLQRLAIDMSGHFNKIPVEGLASSLESITAKSVEAATAKQIQAAGAQPGGVAESGVPRPVGSGSLDKFCIDLTARAKAGEIDPVLGRDPEIRQLIDILTRRRQNNPILTGEAGVGKTAVVEGFALKIVAGDVPDSLKGIRLCSLDLGLLQAGAGVKGEFENRLKSVIEEVKRSPIPVIMFIDEAHTLIGAGGQEGQGDAANLLKPALARGELRTIAATTWSEYKKYFEKDPALTRRFQVVKVEEPSEASAIQMMRGVVATLEKHHKVRILEEAVDACVRLSHRYISGRQLPDKSVSLLDTACARVGMSQASTPGAIEDLQRNIDQLGVEINILKREQVTGADHSSTITLREEEKAKAESDLAAMKDRWEKEKALVGTLHKLRGEIETHRTAEKPDDAKIAELRAELDKVDAEIKALQGETPLVFDVVDRNAVADVVGTWTGIPVGRMMGDEIKNVLNLNQLMGERIKGQAHALDAIAQSMQTARAKLTDPRKPIGIFLMVGTSGVGKTETAITLADLIYGGAQNMTVINMSEFKEEHKVSMLLGSPPGYVGYGEGGVLTEAVRRKPFSVVLLDEMEKAHPGIQDVFYQVFDKGMIKDGQGRDIDFKNTMIIMTSNAGTDAIEKLCADPETMPDAEGLNEALRPELLKVFKPAFLGRVVTVPYFPLAPDIIREIIIINLKKIRERVALNYRAGFSWDDPVIDEIARRCTESQSGARNIENILRRGMLPDLATLFLNRLYEQKPVSAVKVAVDSTSNFSYVLE